MILLWDSIVLFGDVVHDGGLHSVADGATKRPTPPFHVLLTTKTLLIFTSQRLCDSLCVDGVVRFGASLYLGLTTTNSVVVCAVVCAGGWGRHRRTVSTAGKVWYDTRVLL